MSPTVDRPTLMEESGKVPEDAKPKAVRINVNLPTNHFEELKELAAESGMDMSEFVRRAIRFYTFFEKEKHRGKSIYVGQDGRVEKEVILP